LIVKELLKILARCDLNATVVLAKDAEGNDYRELASVDNSLLYESKYRTCGKEVGNPAIILWPFD